MQKTITLSPTTLIIYVIYASLTFLILFARFLMQGFSNFILPFFAGFDILLPLFFMGIITLFYLELRKFNYKKTLLTILFVLYLISHLFFFVYQVFIVYLMYFGQSLMSSLNLYQLFNTLGFIYQSFNVLNLIYLVIGLVMIFSVLMPKLTIYGALYIGASAFHMIVSRLFLINFHVGGLFGATFNLLFSLFSLSMSLIIAFFWYKGDYKYNVSN